MKLSGRLTGYFESTLNNFVFDGLATKALLAMDVLDILEDVPVPMQQEDLAKIAAGEGVSAARIAVNMAYVLGCNPEFTYRRAYTDFMDKMFAGEMYGGVIKAAEAEADAGRLHSACVYFRAAIVLRENDLKAMFGYAMALRELYVTAAKGENEDVEELSQEEQENYIGNFKAETIQVLEEISIAYPDFPEPHYFLGYAYLNMGLYIKADLAWRDFLEVATDAEQKEEIRQRRDQLKGPVEIEKGINFVLSGRFDEGIEVLQTFVSNPAADEWWPFHYYLGLAYASCDQADKAIEQLKRALALNPSHIESMEELVTIYRSKGDSENEEKYSRKIELIRGYEAQDRAQN